MPAQRYRTKEDAQISIYGKSGTVVAAIKNLSKTGACIEWSGVDASIVKGALVRITVHLKDVRKHHQVSAEVVWRAGNRSGINFISTGALFEKISGR